MVDQTGHFSLAFIAASLACLVGAASFRFLIRDPNASKTLLSRLSDGASSVSEFAVSYEPMGPVMEILRSNHGFSSSGTSKSRQVD